MPIRAQRIAAAAALLSAISFSPALADGLARTGEEAGPTGTRRGAVRGPCFHGPGADRSRCRYKIGQVARPARIVHVRRVVSARAVYRRVSYAMLPPCTISTVAGATTYAPLYNHPADLCF